MKVLLVDDDKYTGDLVGKSLEKYNVEFKHIDTPLEAFSQLTSGAYDVAFIDFKISPMDGVDLINSLEKTGIKTKLYLFSGFDKEFLDFKSKPIKHLLSGILSKNDMEEEFEKIFGEGNA